MIRVGGVAASRRAWRERVARAFYAALLVLFVGLAWPDLAGAAAPAFTPEHTASPADRAAAQALYDQGRELMAQGKAIHACPRFEESQRLDSGLGTQYHLANCYEAVGKLASAHILFLEVAAQARILGQKRREQVAQKRAEVLEPRLARLTIQVPYAQTPELVVERDGSPVGRAQWDLPIPVDPGLHQVRASAPGMAPWSAEVDVPDDAAVHTVSIPPLADVRHEASFFEPTSRKAGLVALGVGVATLGVGGVFALQAKAKNDDSNRAGCVGGSCPVAGLALRRQALAAGNRATWALGLGAVSLGAAAALFWVLPNLQEGDEEVAAQGSVGHGVTIQPVASSSGASLHIEGRF